MTLRFWLFCLYSLLPRFCQLCLVAILTHTVLFDVSEAMAQAITTTCPSSGGVVESGVTISTRCSVSSGSLTINGPTASSASGTISVATGDGAAGVAVYSIGTLTGLSNSGNIFSTSPTGRAAIENALRANITTLQNTATGSISGTNGIWNRNVINTLSNSGTITGSGSETAAGIYNGSNGSINTLTNSGSISNTNAYGIYNNAIFAINTLTNTGTITGGLYGINNASIGGIITLNNLQGSASSPLTLTGKLPNNYNIIINSSTNYGQLAVSNTLGSMAFGVMEGPSFPTGTYTSILQGISASKINAGLSGIHNNYYYWSLVSKANDVWDMSVSFDISSNTTGLVTIENLTGSGSANLGTQSLNLTAASGTYSGVISGSGGITINGGDWILTGANTYSGGTTVTSGSLQGNTASLQGAILNNSQVVFDQATDGTYSGVMSGSGSLIKQNSGKLILTGANTYSGGTTISSGTLSVAGTSPTGTGPVTVASGATLMGRGTITGSVNVFGILKPGNSPGYLSTTSSVTMNTGSSYLQDIAGTVQASGSSPVGATGYYSFLNVTNGQFVIQPGATLTPRLSNLFTVDQSGYGSAIFVPRLGNRMRIVTAAGGISGRFSTVTQPAELAAGTQFLPFYNMAGSNSIDLAVIPTSYQSTIAAASGNTNAKSVGGALTKIAQAGLAGTSTAAQYQLLYAISGQSSAQSIANLAQGMSGEVYAATVAVMAQTTQRTQQAVLNRLGETAGLNINMPMATATSATTLGGVPGAGVSSNPNVNPTAEAKAFSNGNIWGDLAYQRGDRSSDSHSGGWNSNLYQLTFGSDFYSSNGTTMGAGFSLSNTTLNPVYGSSTIQQGSLFAYGKMPVESFVVDAMASAGLSYSNISRGDVTGLSSKFKNNSVSGSDVMVSLGLSRPFDTESIRLTPFARVSWQMVTQSSVNEGDAASALSVNRYTGNGVRAVIGLAAGSKADNPMTSNNTYRAYVGVGVDSSALLNPTLNASIVGVNTNITTPNAGTTFVQAGLYGTAKLSDNSFAYAGIAGEARSGQTLGSINVGVKLQF